MREKILLGVLILVVGLTTFGQQNWQKQIEKIKPLVTTEAEIEKILGKPVERTDYLGRYETKDGRYRLIYSQGRCMSALMPKYNVEKGVLIELSFKPKKKVKFESLGIDVSGWRTGTVSDVLPPPIIYYNPGKGIDYGVHEGILFRVHLYQPIDLDYLKCP